MTEFAVSEDADSDHYGKEGREKREGQIEDERRVEEDEREG